MMMQMRAAPRIASIVRSMVQQSKQALTGPANPTNGENAL
jgi:hypothetical protein